MAKNNKKKCPVGGCRNVDKCTKAYFVEDEDMVLKLQSWKRRKEKEERKRIQEEEDSDEDAL